LVSTAGLAAGALGFVFGSSTDWIGLFAIVALVGVGQALALEVDDGSISVSAVGSIAGAALFGPRAALPLAITISAVEWSARRSPFHYVLFNIGTLSLSSLAAAGVFTAGFHGDLGRLVYVLSGVAAGGTYFAVNMGLISLVVSVEGHESWRGRFRERFACLATHYLVYRFIRGVTSVRSCPAGL